MNRDETFELLCSLLEEYSDAAVENVAEEILNSFSYLGEELLDHLDPPVGLKRWLESHGLSLVVTANITPPVVWQALQGEDEEDVEPAEDLQEGLGGSEALLEVGEFVEYRTAPAGPSGQISIGSGRINAITDDGWVIIQDSPTHETWVNPKTDVIRLVPSP
jgi:hypothetical protein